MVVKIIIEMVRMKLEGLNEGIGSLIKDLEEPSESVELRMNVISEPRHAKSIAIEAIESFKNYIQVHFIYEVCFFQFAIILLYFELRLIAHLFNFRKD